MAGDLDDVFARKRSRCSHDCEQHLIDVSSVPRDMSKMDRVRRSFRRLYRKLSLRDETAIGDIETLRTRQADDRQAPFSEWRRNRSDRILKHKGNLEGGRAGVQAGRCGIVEDCRWKLPHE